MKIEISNGQSASDHPLYGWFRWSEISSFHNLESKKNSDNYLYKKAGVTSL